MIRFLNLTSDPCLFLCFFTIFKDIDECQRQPCDRNADCTNTAGSYQCQCRSGYHGNGFTCSLITCPRLSHPLNGRVVVEGTGFTSTAQFNCNSGYRLVGSDFLVCLVNGSWSSPPPRCQGNKTILNFNGDLNHLSLVAHRYTLVFLFGTPSLKTCDKRHLWAHCRN